MKTYFEQYLEKGKEIIKIITNATFEACLTGECVRNKILDIDFKIVEICTSAQIETLKDIFVDYKTEKITDGVIKLYYHDLPFIINTYKAIKKKNSKEIYSKNLIDDLLERDFTINALAMSISGKITDASDGFGDLEKKRIKSVGKPKICFTNDPLRILKAITLVSELGFKIENKTLKAMKKNKGLLNVPINKIVIELMDIFNGKYFKKAINYMGMCNIFRRIPILGKELRRIYTRKGQYDSLDLVLSTAFIENNGYDEDFLVLANDPFIVKRIVSLGVVAPKGDYDTLLLYDYGLDVCKNANIANFYLKRSSKKTKKIEKQFNALPIKKVCDLAFKGEDVLRLNPDIEGAKLQNLMEDIIYKVLHKELLNDYEDIKNYTLKQLNMVSDNKPNTSNESKDKDKDKNKGKFFDKQKGNSSIIPDDKISQLEKRFEEYERRLDEKDKKIEELERNQQKNKIDNDVETIVKKNIDILKKMEYIDGDNEETVEELQRLYKEILNKNPSIKSKNESVMEDENKKDEQN